MKKITLIIILIFSLVLEVNAFTTSGSDQTFEFAITSGKNTNISSSDFKTYLVVGGISATTNSSDFKTEVGFLRTTPYLDAESCQVDSECVGGFCCSSVCQSTSCPIDDDDVAAPVAGGASAAGGGGGGAAVKKKDFTIDKDLITTSIRQGDTYKTKFTIKNIGTEELSFDINASALEDLLLLSDTQFSLASNEAKDIEVTISVAEEKNPDVYSGNIKIKANNIVKTLPVIIEVQAKKSLFDIIVQVIPQYKYVLKTENIIANITLFNIGDLKPVEVELYYSIRDTDGNDLISGLETLYVYDKVFRFKELELPKNISFGTYLFYSRVTFGTETAAAGDIFYVVSEKPATCFDGIQNQGEEGIDCGGPCKQCKIRAKPLSLFLSKIRSDQLSLFLNKHRFTISGTILGIVIIAFIVLKLKKLFRKLKVKRSKEIKKKRREEKEAKKIGKKALRKKRLFKSFRNWRVRRNRRKQEKLRKIFALKRERLLLKAERERQKEEKRRLKSNRRRFLIRKCTKFIEKSHRALEKNKIKKSKRYYNKLLDLYLKLSHRDKKQIYDNINYLYKQIENKEGMNNKIFSKTS